MLSPLAPAHVAVRGCCLPDHIDTRTCTFLIPNTNHILKPRTKHGQTTYQKNLSFTPYLSTSKSTRGTLTVIATHGIATVERQHRYCTALTLASYFSPREGVSYTTKTIIIPQSKNHGANYVSQIRYVDDPKDLPTGPRTPRVLAVMRISREVQAAPGLVPFSDPHSVKESTVALVHKLSLTSKCAFFRTVETFVDQHYDIGADLNARMTMLGNAVFVPGSLSEQELAQNKAVFDVLVRRPTSLRNTDTHIPEEPPAYTAKVAVSCPQYKAAKRVPVEEYLQDQHKNHISSSVDHKTDVRLLYRAMEGPLEDRLYAKFALLPVSHPGRAYGMGMFSPLNLTLGTRWRYYAKHPSTTTSLPAYGDIELAGLPDYLTARLERSKLRTFPDWRFSHDARGDNMAEETSLEEFVRTGDAYHTLGHKDNNISYRTLRHCDSDLSLEFHGGAEVLTTAIRQALGVEAQDWSRDCEFEPTSPSSSSSHQKPLHPDDSSRRDHEVSQSFVAQTHPTLSTEDAIIGRFSLSRKPYVMSVKSSACSMTLTANTPSKRLFTDSGVDIETRHNSHHQRVGARLEEAAAFSVVQAPPSPLANITTDPHIATPEMARSTVGNLSAMNDNSELDVSEASDIIASVLSTLSFGDSEAGEGHANDNDATSVVAGPSSRHLLADIDKSPDAVQGNTDDTGRADPVQTILVENPCQIQAKEKESKEGLAPFPEVNRPEPGELEMYAKTFQLGGLGFIPTTPKAQKRIGDVSSVKPVEGCKKYRHYESSMHLIEGGQSPQSVRKETLQRRDISVFDNDSEGVHAHTDVCVERTEPLSASAAEALRDATISPTSWCRSPCLLSESQSLSDVLEASCDEGEEPAKVDMKGKGIAKNRINQQTTNDEPEDYFGLTSVSTKERRWKENEPAEMPRLRTPLRGKYKQENLNLDGANDPLDCATMISSAIYESDTSIHSIERKTMDWLDHELAKNISEDEKATIPTPEQKEEVKNVGSPVKKGPAMQEYAPVWDSDSDEEDKAKLIIMPIANKPLNIPVTKHKRRERQELVVNRPPDDPFKPKFVQRDFPNAPSLAGDIGMHRKSYDSWPPASNQHYKKVEKIDWYSQTRSPNRSSSSRPMSPRLRYSGRPSMGRASTNQSEGGLSTFTENSTQGSPSGRAAHPEQSEPVGVMSPTTERNPTKKHVSFSRGEQIFSFDEEEDGRLEFCGVCKKRHIEPGPPSMLPQRDKCLSMLPQYFPKSRYPGEEWKEFIRRTNEHLRICQALDGHGDLVVKTTDWNIEYHDRSPDWEMAGRTGGWWKCRVGSEDPKVHKVEKECKKCIQHAIQKEQAIERTRRNNEGNVSPVERSKRDLGVQGQGAESPLYRLRKAKWESERWTERYMRIGMEEDKRIVVERMKRRGY